MFNFLLQGKVGELLAPVGSPEQQLLIAIQNGQHEKVTELMDGPKRVSATCCNERGVQPIHAACQAGNQELIATLLELGASIYAQDHTNNSCLHYAAKHGQTEVVKWLTKQGAPVGLRNNLRQSAYDVGINHAIRQYLLPLQLQEEAQQESSAPLLEQSVGIHQQRTHQHEKSGLQNVNFGEGIVGRQPSGSSLVPDVMSSNQRMTELHGPPPVGPPPCLPIHTGAAGPVGPPPAAALRGDISTSVMLPEKTSSSGALSAPSSMHGNHPHISTPPNSMPVLTHKQLALGSSGATVEYRPIKADGFHTSASDKQLQKLYGHGENTKIKKNLAPPPIFGRAGGPAGDDAGEAVPPPTFSYNAYSGTRASTPPRYVSYDAVTNTTGYVQPTVPPSQSLPQTWTAISPPPFLPPSLPPSNNTQQAQTAVDLRPVGFQPVYVFNPSTDKVIAADSRSKSVL